MGGTLNAGKWFTGDTSLFGGVEWYIPYGRGLRVKIGSGYRDAAAQDRLKSTESSIGVVAKYSWHELGLAIDLNIYKHTTKDINPNGDVIWFKKYLQVESQEGGKEKFTTDLTNYVTSESYNSLLPPVYKLAWKLFIENSEGWKQHGDKLRSGIGYPKGQYDAIHFDVGGTTSKEGYVTDYVDETTKIMRIFNAIRDGHAKYSPIKYDKSSKYK